MKEQLSRYEKKFTDKVIEQYGRQQDYCNLRIPEIKPKDFASKKRTFVHKLETANAFIKSLGLRVEILDADETVQKNTICCNHERNAISHKGNTIGSYCSKCNVFYNTKGEGLKCK